MYADEDARGGVLEPEGIVGLKFRRDKQVDTMARLDPQYRQLRAASLDTSLTPDQLSDVKVKLATREELLLPVYTQISLQFADLHDRAGRMLAKGVIRQPLVWKHARRFFYWRLRRRLNEESILRKMAAAAPAPSRLAAPGLVPAPAPAPSTTAPTPASTPAPPANNATPPTPIRARHLDLLQAWTGMPAATFDTDDRAVAVWYEEKRKEVHARVDGLRAEAVAAEVAALLRANKDGGLRGVRTVLGMLPLAERDVVLRYLAGE